MLLPNVYGNSNLLVEGKGAELDFSRGLSKRKTFKLDDPFKLQLFAFWKAAGITEANTHLWMDLFFTGEYLEALQTLSSLKGRNIQKIKETIEIYLLYRLGHYQSFLTKWIDLSSEKGLLKTELGLALDQIVGPQMASILQNSGFYLTGDLKKKLGKIEGEKSLVNDSLQALGGVSKGAKAVRWIGQLSKDDPLRLPLAYAAIFDYARKGMLGASGNIVKKVVEPWMEKSNESEEIAFYYLTLARLLYQAGAWGESEHFYRLVPESSTYFLSARTEVLWIYLRNRQFAKLKGDLTTLELNVFEDRFYPDIYLAKAMMSVMLCQFLDAREAIHRFVRVNKKWAGKIEQELASSKTSLVHPTFSTDNWQRALKSLARERSALEKSKIPFDQKLMISTEKEIQMALHQQSRQQWENRKKILEDAFYRIKFVRIELLGRMRVLAGGAGKQAIGRDSLRLYTSAPVRGDQIVFPHDKTLWAGDLFNMNAQVRNLCASKKVYEN